MLVFVLLQTKERITVQKTLEKSLTYEEYTRAMIYADRVTITHTANSRASALRWAFNWDKTDEGFRYWENIHDDLWYLDKRDKKLLQIRKGIMIGAITVIVVCMYKIITL